MGLHLNVDNPHIYHNQPVRHGPVHHVQGHPLWIGLDLHARVQIHEAILLVETANPVDKWDFVEQVLVQTCDDVSPHHGRYLF
jgi:hypothetical protein